MKNARVIMAICALALTESTTVGDDDIQVRMPEKLTSSPHPISDAERQRQDKEKNDSELIGRLNQKLPYHELDDIACKFNTIGQLVKLSDTVAIGKVVDVDDAVSVGAAKQRLSRITLKVNLESNLLGRVAGDAVLLNIQWWDRKRPPQKGDRWLMFIASEDQRANLLDAMRWDFDKTKVRGVPQEAPFVLGQSRGTIDLAGGEEEKEMLIATTEYIDNLRRQKWDAERYYALLCKLTHSPIKRIQDDAKIDLLNFIRTCSSFDPNRVLGDKKLDDGLQEFVRLIILPSRQPAKNPENKN